MEVASVFAQSKAMPDYKLVNLVYCEMGASLHLVLLTLYAWGQWDAAATCSTAAKSLYSTC